MQIFILLPPFPPPKRYYDKIARSRLVQIGPSLESLSGIQMHQLHPSNDATIFDINKVVNAQGYGSNSAYVPS